MSETKKATEGAASVAVKERGKGHEPRSERFTPLRSYVRRTITEGARGELALSPLIPVPRLQN